MGWQLKELREHIRRQPGGGRDLLAVVTSIARAHAIFEYHLVTARDAMKGILDEEEPTSLKNFRAVFGDPENAIEVNRAHIISEAHIIGCMHTIRSIADFFAQLVNGLVLNRAFTADQCELKAVLPKMPISDLQAGLQALYESHWFNYVTSFVNTTKHRRLVQHSPSMAFDEERAGIRIGAFEYKGTEHPQYWIRDVLEGVVEAKNALIDCGNLLNLHCLIPDIDGHVKEPEDIRRYPEGTGSN